MVSTNILIIFDSNLTKVIFFISGGGGVGKSFLIKLLSQWIDYILEQPGDIAYYPKVIRLAYTGNAAYLIGKLYLIRFLSHV